MVECEKNQLVLKPQNFQLSVVSNVFRAVPNSVGNFFQVLSLMWVYQVMGFPLINMNLYMHVMHMAMLYCN